MKPPFPYNSPGVASGRIPITSSQYERIPLEQQKNWEAIVTPSCTLYRYVEDGVASIVAKQDILFDGFISDVEVVQDVCRNVPARFTEPILFEIDAEEEDFDYVQGVCYTALQVFDDARDEEFILTYQFGDYWTLQIVWPECS